MANGIEQEKEALRQELRQMMAQGLSQEEIIAHRDQKLAEIEGKQAAAQQAATAQQGDGIMDSNLAAGSGESPDFSDEYTEVGGAKIQQEQPKEIGGWDNFKNNIENVYNRNSWF